MGNKIFIEAKNITKTYGRIYALKDVTFSCKMGEVVSIVGDNGAGKSTLIKIISGLIDYDCGELIINDKNVFRYNTKRAIEEGIATVYQDLALIDNFDISQNIFLGSEPLKGPFIDKSYMDQRARALLDHLKININNINAKVKNLSGGQRQGIAIARAISRGSKLLILDEPTAAMGVTESKMILDLIMNLSKTGITIIMISHNLAHVFKVSDKINVMRKGKIVSCTETSETNQDEILNMITGE